MIIVDINAMKRNSKNISHLWMGTVVLSQRHHHAKTTFVKKLLKNFFPESKRSIRVKRYRKTTYYDFIINFESDANEAEFIMMLPNLKGMQL